MAALLAEIIATYGVAAVLGWLVDAGILPAWVLGETSGGAVEHEPYLIEQLAETVSVNVGNPYYGLQALATKLTRLSADLAADYAALLAAVNGTGSAPPSWWVNPPSETGIAEQVWTYSLDPGDPYTTGQHMTYLELWAHHMAAATAYPLRGDPFLIVSPIPKYPPD